MDAPIAPDEDTKFIDTFMSDDNQGTDLGLMQESLTDELNRTVSTLSSKEKEVLFMYYGIGHNHEFTLEEIGAQFDLTRERVRQIKEKAIRRLKHSNKSKNLKTYL
jgi:RNA polymerase primary sigma factor